MNEDKPRNLDGVLADIADRWPPRTIAVVNDYDVRVVKVRGEFTRHTHPGTDEFFLVLSGRLTIRMDHGDVVPSKGHVYVVPRGSAHQPCSDADRLQATGGSDRYERDVLGPRADRGPGLTRYSGPLEA